MKNLFSNSQVWRLLPALFIGLACEFGMAQGGPPLQTDDPGTPGNGNWEINVAMTAEGRFEESLFEAPLLDINYGLGNRVQIMFEIPFILRDASGESIRSGFGNSMFGVKWRFFENQNHGLDMSVYPQFEFNNPTDSVIRGLADPGNRFLLPVQLAKDFGPIDVNGELGYRVVGSDRDEWIAGLAAGRQSTKRLQLLGEIFAAGKIGGKERETTLGAGGRYRLCEQIGLLFMAGRGMWGSSTAEPRFIAYLGFQLGIFQKPRH
jgi:hypothetical protein